MNDPLTEAVGHVDKLVEHMIWMSGSSDFAPEGPGGTQWQVAREDLFAAMEWLDRVAPYSVTPEGQEQLDLFDVDDFDSTWKDDDDDY